jgi:cellulose synthase/poly-beta-1,6-N-acetylglucosamine synthase-like glycosyltransferase
MFVPTLFFALTLTITLLFFLYGFNHYYLLNAARKYWIPALPDHSMARPRVSIQLPVYNEKYVIRRLVSACAEMAEAYGIEKTRIIILDDSDDDTVLEVDKVVEEFKEKHFQIEVLRRGCRDGFKAGALQVAIAQTEEEFIAIFDADFIPSAEFLLNTLPYFAQNECLGIIQTRWTHHNKDYNLLTQALSHAIDVHFLIEQTGRYVTGSFQNFNGSGGVLRKKAILDAGGWQADTLAEDLDLSYRMQILGYRILYLRDILCPGEIPPTVPNIKQQQSRWANGAMRVARKILPGLLRNRKLGLKLRLQAFIHLTGYMIQPLMVISFVLSCLSALGSVNAFNASQTKALIHSYNTIFATRDAAIIFLQNLVWLILTPLIALCTLAPWFSLLSTMKIQNLPLVRNLANLLILLLLCFGISLSTTQGVIRGLFTNHTWEWTRTPKFTDLQNKQDWQRSTYQIPLDLVWIGELIFTILGLWAIGVAIAHLNFTVLLILVPFTISYGFVFFFSILQSRKANA